MALYERVSAQIYSIILRYAAPADVHVYSVDESFIDATPYLSHYEETASATGQHPAHVMAMTMIKDVLKETGITATVGIGTNLYLAKVCMDTIAKKAKPDADGVRIAELNEDSYKFLLWDHRPLTDFWRVGRGTAARLAPYGIDTMGKIARQSVKNDGLLYHLFGVNAELLIDHAWGWEPCTIKDVKAYKPEHNSFSNGQVLTSPYDWKKARVVAKEMADAADCADRRLRHKQPDGQEHSLRRRDNNRQIRQTGA